jgi:hypothetical protein
MQVVALAVKYSGLSSNIVPLQLNIAMLALQLLRSLPK